MNFEKYLLEQIEKHPSVQPQDIVKLCYQAAYGAEHLLSDLTAAENYLTQEYDATEAADIDLYEIISDHVCRVNLAAWKAKGLPLQDLFNMFVASARIKKGSSELFLTYLQTTENLLPETQVSFSFADWQSYLTSYKQSGTSAVHHSPQYREAEKPSYRIVDRQYLNF